MDIFMKTTHDQGVKKQIKRTRNSSVLCLQSCYCPAMLVRSMWVLWTVSKPSSRPTMISFTVALQRTVPPMKRKQGKERKALQVLPLIYVFCGCICKKHKGLLTSTHLTKFKLIPSQKYLQSAQLLYL